MVVNVGYEMEAEKHLNAGRKPTTRKRNLAEVEKVLHSVGHTSHSESFGAVLDARQSPTTECSGDGQKVITLPQTVFGSLSRLTLV
jgi:hypothetical protein